MGRGVERWLRGIRGDLPPAVVLGGSVNGLSFVRSLGRRGVPTLLMDSDRLVGTFTRFGQVCLLPPADERPEEWLEFLRQIGSRLPAPGALFVTSDVHGVLVAEHSAELQRSFRFLIPSPTTMEQIVNKRAQYELAAAAGIPIPSTLFPSSEADLDGVGPRVGFPCILKPYKSHVARKAGSAKVALVHTHAELVEKFRRLASQDVSYMVQAIIPGDDSSLFGYLGLWGADGEERAWLTKRKLRQYPPLFGDGSLQITVDAPEVVELSRRLLRAFDYRGFVGVEFKFDARDGRYRLMEINPRTVSGNQLAISAGVDFPALGYEHLTGVRLQPSPGGHGRTGVKYLNEEWDVKAFLALHAAGQLEWRQWLRTVRRSEARAIGAWDDPWPLVVTVSRMLRAGLERIWAGITRGGASSGSKSASANP